MTLSPSPFEISFLRTEYFFAEGDLSRKNIIFEEEISPLDCFPGRKFLRRGKILLHLNKKYYEVSLFCSCSVAVGSV